MNILKVGIVFFLVSLGQVFKEEKNGLQKNNKITIFVKNLL